MVQRAQQEGGSRCVQRCGVATAAAAKLPVRGARRARPRSRSFVLGVSLCGIVCGGGGGGVVSASGHGCGACAARRQLQRIQVWVLGMGLGNRLWPQ